MLRLFWSPSMAVDLPRPGWESRGGRVMVLSKVSSMSTAEVPPGGATDALVERLNAATIGTLELASVHIGNRLGFYRALSEEAMRHRASWLGGRTRRSATSASGSSSRRSLGLRRRDAGAGPAPAATGCPPLIALCSSRRRA